MSTTNQELTSTETNSLILIKKWLNDKSSVTGAEIDMIEYDEDVSNIKYMAVKNELATIDYKTGADFKLSTETIILIARCAINDAVAAIRLIITAYDEHDSIPATATNYTNYAASSAVNAAHDYTVATIADYNAIAHTSI